MFDPTAKTHILYIGASVRTHTYRDGVKRHSVTLHITSEGWGWTHRPTFNLLRSTVQEGIDWEASALRLISQQSSAWNADSTFKAECLRHNVKCVAEIVRTSSAKLLIPAIEDQYTH